MIDQVYKYSPKIPKIFLKIKDALLTCWDLDSTKNKTISNNIIHMASESCPLLAFTTALCPEADPHLGSIYHSEHAVRRRTLSQGSLVTQRPQSCGWSTETCPNNHQAAAERWHPKISQGSFITGYVFLSHCF